MATTDAHATIRAALEFQRRWAQEQHAESVDPYYVEMMAGIDSALDSLAAGQWTPIEPATGWPHSEGYYAFEGRLVDGAESFRDVFEVAYKKGMLHVGVAMDWEPVTNLIGAWTKLHVPWDAPQNNKEDSDGSQ